MNSYKRATLGVILLTAALIGNLFPIKVFFGFDWLWGSVWVLIIIHYFGPVFGKWSAFASGVGALLGGHCLIGPFVYLLEGLGIDYFWRRRKCSLLKVAVGYWLLVSIFIILMNALGLLQFRLEALQFMVLKLLANGIINAIIAEAVIVFAGRFIIGEKTALPTLRRFFSILLVTSVSLFMLFLLSLLGRAKFKEMEAGLSTQLAYYHQTVTTAVEHELTHQSRAIALLAEVAGPIMSESAVLQRHTELIRRANPGLVGLYVADNKGISLAFSPALDGDGKENIGKDFSHRNYLKDLPLPPNGRLSSVLVSDVFDDTDYSGHFVSLTLPVLYNKQQLGSVTGLFDLSAIETFLVSLAREDAVITLVDGENRIIAGTDPIFPIGDVWMDLSQSADDSPKGNVEHRMTFQSGPPLEQWRGSHYVLQRPLSFGNRDPGDWSLIVKQPIISTIDKMYGFYNHIISASLAFMALLTAAILWGANWLAEPIWALVKQMRKLPTQICETAEIRWPEGRIVEQHALIAGYKEMSYAVARHIDQIDDYSKQLTYLAERDSLTGLLNRVTLPERLANCRERAKEQQQLVGLLFVDLDNFKAINDTFGHDAGDKFLIETASRLQSSCPKQCSIFRQGGDEFVVVLENINDIEDVEALIDIVFGVFSHPVIVQGNEVSTTVSIGVSLFPKDGDDVNTLLKRADRAMYHAKKSESNRFCFYEKSMEQDLVLPGLLTDLHQAIEAEQLRLHFQPIVDCKSLEVQGLEVLVRWQHPKLGLLMPGQFLPTAKGRDLIIEIDQWVFETACRKLVSYFHNPPILFVNISGQHFSQCSRFLHSVTQILDDTRFEPQSLVLEITESELVENLEAAEAVLSALRERGIRIALDDFGQGYSSLSYLAHLPIDILKIPEPFASRCLDGSKDMTIIDGVIEMADKLNILITAEGIESPQQLAFFADRGCDLVQGFYLGRPQPLAKLIEDA